jgi:phosphoglycerol transferase MdoB-like AlkP superfamily enzyme
VRITLAFAIAVLLSFAVDAIALPRAGWRRAPLAWAGHILAVLFLFAFFMLLSRRPLFSTFCTVALLASMITAINNPKFKTLREPFIFLDLSLCLDLFRHSRFYLPFYLVSIRAYEIIIDIVGIVILILVYHIDLPVVPHLWWISLLVMTASLTLSYWLAVYLPLMLDVEADQRRHGFFVVFVAYLLNGLRPSTIRNFRNQVKNGPFAGDNKVLTHNINSDPVCSIDPLPAINDIELPDVIVIQSESYFDARRISSAVNPSVYTQFDRACRESTVWGELAVPAWGANTTRSEFSFLTGLAPEKLGYSRFYPYLFLRHICASLPGWLKRYGYHTLAIHPFYANFFGRHRVFPLLNFDHFWDITHFRQAQRSGYYVADTAVADTIFATLDQKSSQAPHFIFTITMENHGPLHLETVHPGEAQLHHTLGEELQWRELTIYLRHIANADAMLGSLLDRLRARSKPTVVCFYGDHVPALSKQFQALGVIPKHSQYFIWRNFGDRPAARKNIRIEALGSMVLTAMMSKGVPT